MDELKAFYRKLLVGEKLFDNELNQIKELLTGIARQGSRTFVIWFQGVETPEMTEREKILTKLSQAGLVILEWKYTDHNAYIKARITEKGAKLTGMLTGPVQGGPP